MPSPRRPFATRPASSPRIDSTALLGPLRVDVGQHDGHLEAAQEQRRELRGHQPGADEADALDPPRLRVGDPGRALDPAARRRRRRRSTPAPRGPAAARRAPPPRRRSPPRASTSPRPRSARAPCTGAGAWPWTTSSTRERALRTTSATSERSAAGSRFPSPASIRRRRSSSDSSTNSTGLEHVVDEPELERVGGADQPVLLERVVDDQLHGRLGADQPRRELRAAPGGEEPEEHLGEADVADVRRHRADVAVERELEAASERGAVDRRERRERQLAQPPEELVPGGGALPGALGGDPRELRDVGARGEDERLARDEQPAPVARPRAAEHVAERPQRRLAERVRLAPVGAVVDRDERDRPDARVEALEVELRDGSRQPCRAFSQRSAAPIPIPMQSAVSP